MYSGKILQQSEDPLFILDTHVTDGGTVLVLKFRI
jgi:hypothetical protein